MSDLVLGIDVGTSGVRVAAIDQAGHVAAFGDRMKLGVYDLATEKEAPAAR